MFANAKVMEVKKTSSSKSAYKPVDKIAGWEQLAALDAAAKALAALVDLRKGEMIEMSIRPELVARGLAAHQKPGSLSPVEGEGKGSAYIAKRSTRSVLTEDEVALIDEMTGDVSDFVEVVEDAPSMLAVNPAYADDQALLTRIDRALKNVKDLPEDFIIQTPSVSKTVVSDAAVDNLFRLGENAVEQLMPILTNIVLRPVFGGKMETAWDIIRPMIPEAVDALATAPKKVDRTPKGDAKKTLRAQLEASVKA